MIKDHKRGKKGEKLTQIIKATNETESNEEGRCQCGAQEWSSFDLWGEEGGKEGIGRNLAPNGTNLW